MNAELNVMTRSILAGFACAIASVSAHAQVTVSDNFTLTTNTLSWQTLGSACLTAGSNSNTTANLNAGLIPMCSPSGDGGEKGGYGDSTYPGGYLAAGYNDPSGNGALRLTNGVNSDTGAVIYNSVFPSTAGIAITFTAVSYDGDSGGTMGDGADGLAFFLLDASYTPSIGSWGGSLGYSCSNSNSPYNGQSGAYIGLGIDEYGNFLNSSDNTSSGVACNSSISSCSNSNPQYQGTRIGLRGRGNLNWTQLNSLYPSLYPSTLSSSQQATAIKNTCKSGYLYSNSVSGGGYFSSNQTSTAIADYAPIANGSLAFSTAYPIAKENAGARTNAQSRTYNLKITSTGLLTLTYALNDSNGIPGNAVPVLTNSPIFSANGALPANFKFGFSAGTGGSNNIHEITCFQAAPADDSNSSAGVNTVQTGQVRTGTQVYLAYYHTTDWWGQLTSQNLTFNTTSNSLVIGTTNWDSACVLTGDLSGASTSTLTGGTTAGACPSTNSTSDTVQAPANRNIMTSSGGAGIAFEWASLSSTQQGWLNDDSNGTTRTAYLRGDRSNENNTANPSGIYRARIGVLGDITDSSPTWVGAPNLPYPSSAGTSVTTWVDNLYSTTTDPMPENSSSYGTYQSSQSTRLNVVYVGANDGFLHGFEAGSYDSTGTVFSTTYNDGKEIIAYMPNAVISTIRNSSTASLDYSNINYARNFYVDATPGTGDVYYGGAWHTWLVGGLGAGGKAIFALDITNPSYTNFAEANAATVVKGEWDTSTSTLGNNLGQTYGTPQIRRFHNGQWGFVFGNGYNSANGVAGVFIGLLNTTSGAPTFIFLSTSTGSTSSPNGIFTPEVVDLDGDHIADYIYAGDLQGNVWRWDVTAATSSTWVSTAPVKIFAAGATHPISTQVQAVATPNPGGQPRVLIDFGTGMQIETPTATTYASGTQAVYGIWDGNMSTWNNTTGVQTANKYDAYPITPPSTNPYALTAGQVVASTQLEAQTITTTSSLTNNGVLQNYRTMSNNAVCWADLTTCTTGTTNNNSQYGWIYTMPAPSAGATAGEQVVYNPIVENGVFIANTYVAASAQACTVTQPTGWTMALNPATGGSLPSSFFVNPGITNNGVTTAVNESQVQLNATGSPFVVNSNNTNNLVYQTIDNGGGVQQINYPGGLALRLNWTELR